MTEQSANNKRIAKNTLLLYFRMVILMFVTLYTSRVILDALGVEDYGIYNVVGGVVGLLGFFMSSLTNVSQRYLNLGIGFNDDCLTIKYFKQCGTILFLFSLFVLFIGETIGLWFVMNKLIVPSERIVATFWVYQFSLISIICSINQVNFLGAIIAHEKMNVYAYLGLFEAVARLLVAFLIVNSTFDHLILYSALTAMVSVIVFVFHFLYCHFKFETCRIGFHWDRPLVREMFSFISANLFGCLAWSAGVQGSNIVMNIFFGPVVNAAKGISAQITAVVSRFTDNVMTAIKPQIIKSYASGDIAYTLNLAMKSSKLSFFISAIISVPILIETEYIISLWLSRVPEFTVVFSRIVVVEAFATVFVSPLWIVANATGNIKRNQVYGRIFSLLALPISYVTLIYLPIPVLPVIICALMQFCYWGYCVYDIKRQLNLSIKSYLAQVVFPSFSLLGLLLLFGILVSKVSVSDTLVIFLMKVAILILMGAILSYLFMTKSEKTMVKSLVLKKKH